MSNERLKVYVTMVASLQDVERGQSAGLSPTQEALVEECRAMAEMLLGKNLAYGDSAFTPLGVFAKADADLLIRARIDDKLSRIMRGTEGAFSEDTLSDLIGYLVILRVHRKMQKGTPA